MAYFRCEKSTKILKNLLWNNPSPTTAFSAQTLSLDLSKYEGVIIRCSWGTNWNTDLQKPYQLFNYVPKDGVEHWIGTSLSTSAANNLFGRKVTVTDSGITFSTAGYPATLANANAGFTIPTEIYGYVYEPDMGEVDNRKFILKNGIFQGTQGVNYGVLGTLTQNTGFVTISSGTYSTGIAPFISASDKTKYKRVVFDAITSSAGTFRLYYSTTETGSRTNISTNQWAVDLSSLSDNIFLYLMPSGNTMNYYNIYLE